MGLFPGIWGGILEIEGIGAGSVGGSTVGLGRRERLEVLLCRELFLTMFMLV